MRSPVTSSGTRDRKRFKRLEPWFGKSQFTPVPTCQHEWIRVDRGFVCMHCDRAHPADQFQIDQSNPPEPKNAEDRAADEIQLLRTVLERDGLAQSHRKSIQSRIDYLEEEIGYWMPTRFQPTHLKGGLGK